MGRPLTGTKGAQVNALLYSGNYGVPLNAIGANADKVEARLRSAGVPCVRSKTVPLVQLPALLLSADAHLITLRTTFSGIVLPSKVYACIASSRPIIYVGPDGSDIHLLCSDQAPHSYLRIQPGDDVDFAAALDRLAQATAVTALTGNVVRRSGRQ